MDPILAQVFALFPEAEIGIIGSALKDAQTCKDIDVLFLSQEDYEQACHGLQKKWNGWDAYNGHVRITNIIPPEIGKTVQLIQLSTITEFDQHPHEVLLRDGSVVHEGAYFHKEPGWVYKKWPYGKGKDKDGNDAPTKTRRK